MNEIETVRQEVTPLPEQAKMIVVKDSVTLAKANDFFLTIKGLRKKIADTFNPIIQKANEAHKEALNQKALIEAPLIVAEKYLNGQVTDYTREQNRIREEEERRLREQAIKEEAERRAKVEAEQFAKAAELEALGEKEAAESLMQEAIEEKEKPIEVYVPPPVTPKIKLEGATVRTYWHAEIVDLLALCKAIAEGKQPLAYINPDMPLLNTLAGRLKKELSIPGVKAVSTSSVAATGRKVA